MTAPIPTLARRYDLVRGFAVEFTVGGSDTGGPQFVAEWSPRRPNRREFRRLLNDYRAARHRFAAEVSEQLGGALLIVEL